jgi:hypothetical protein
MKLLYVLFINLVFVINKEIMTLNFLMFTTILFPDIRRTCCLYLHSSTRLHGVISRKTVMIIIFAMRTSSFVSMFFIRKLLSVGSIKHLSVKICGGEWRYSSTYSCTFHYMGTLCFTPRCSAVRERAQGTNSVRGRVGLRTRLDTVERGILYPARIEHPSSGS